MDTSPFRGGAVSNGLNENVIIQVFNGLAMLIAKFYKDHIYPAEFRRVFYLGGVDVEVTVRPNADAQKTQPIGGAASWDEQRAEQGSGL